MSNCNCEPKKYNVSMGCCQPVLAPIENYYTKYQIDKMLEGIEESGCCITEDEVDEKIEQAVSGIDLTDYALKEEIPSLEGYATEQWVLSKGYITGVDLSNYATLDDIPDTSDYALRDEIPSLSGYATEQYVSSYTYSKSDIDQKIVNIESGGEVDLSNYYTKAETNSLLNNKLDASAYTPTDLSGYALKNEIPTKVSELENDAPYITQSSISTTLNNYLLKNKIWCGTQSEYDSIANKDSETLYLIHE